MICSINFFKTKSFRSIIGTMAVLLALPLFSCSNAAIVNDQNEEFVGFQVATVHFEDSIKKNDGSIFYKADIDIPVEGADSLVKVIKAWINEELGGTYSGELNFDQDMLSSYSKVYFTNFNDVVDSIHGTEIEIRKVAETDKYVSYIMIGSYSERGKNYSSNTCGMTFSKEDCSRNGWNLIANPGEIKTNIREAIKSQYFDNNQADYLNAINVLVRDTTDFPLPSAGPWLVEGDSIQFVYQPYEIAQYSAGMPSCRLALKDIVTSLSVAATQLMEQ